ncbi:hypothetical protein CY34DRAFT_18356 [Suillus luteus UH-Slu-Lm8-n1]|uniref:Ubinuclein middle domain-containing protein n=1 Tax=Suillus luteus UH-Slu-Lm8-n1 TaxID=930992 RepID=A0A0C9Z7G3_9AGAM|nr:hypothetical protein CY34DRAFT_18356 [Suillus luteus UH-Slu-Lm8-n1]
MASAGVNAPVDLNAVDNSETTYLQPPKTIDTVLEKIANVHPYAQMALGALSAASKIIIAQAERDKSILSLLENTGSMDKTVRLWDAATGQPVVGLVLGGRHSQHATPPVVDVPFAQGLHRNAAGGPKDTDDDSIRDEDYHGPPTPDPSVQQQQQAATAKYEDRKVATAPSQSNTRGYILEAVNTGVEGGYDSMRRTKQRRVLGVYGNELTPTPPKPDTSDSEAEGEPKVKEKHATSEHCDVNDPFIDDSELNIDNRNHFAQTKQQGFYVSSGEVALMKDSRTPKKPKSKKVPAEAVYQAKTRHTVIEDNGKKRKVVDIRDFHPELQLAIEDLKFTILKESWGVKGKFPPSVKPILADVALKAVNLGEYDEDFFNLMPVLFPYNRFTMTKLIKRTIFTDHLKILTVRQDELLQQLAGLTKEGFSKAQEEWEKSVVAWEEAKIESEAGAASAPTPSASADATHPNDGAGSGIDGDNTRTDGDRTLPDGAGTDGGAGSGTDGGAGAGTDGGGPSADGDNVPGTNIADETRDAHPPAQK